jgi:hypothetical protein
MTFSLKTGRRQRASTSFAARDRLMNRHDFGFAKPRSCSKAGFQGRLFDFRAPYDDDVGILGARRPAHAPFIRRRLKQA